MRYSTLGLATASFLAILPFTISRWFFYSAVNTKYFFVIGVIDVLLLYGAYLLATGTQSIVWKHRWLLYAFGLLLLSQYVSSLTGVFLERSLWSDILRSTGVVFLTHVAVFAVLLSEFLTESDWRLVRRAVAISAGIFGAFAIIGTYGLGLITTTLWIIKFSDDGLTIGNSTFAGIYLFLALVVASIELVRSWQDRYWRRILLAAIAVIALSPLLFNFGIFIGRTALSDVLRQPLLILGSARASSATMFVIGVLLGGWGLINRFAPARARAALRVMWPLTILFGSIAAVALLFTSGSSVQRAYIETSTAARPIIWEAGLEAVRERPYLGWGPENFNDAYERHFNNQLYLEENIGEVWFDRAHNVVVVTLVSVGLIGAAVILLFGVSFVFVVYRAWRARRISDVEALVLAALLPAHALQLQTGFDTVASYALVGVIIGSVLALERQDVAPSAPLPAWTLMSRRIGAAVLALTVILSLKYAFYDELVRQRALVRSFTAPYEEQRALVRASLAQASDWESLRLSAGSFVKGAIESAGRVENRQAYLENVLKTAGVYEERYQAYLARHPNYYRARMNYAYLLLFKTALGENRTQEAKTVIRESYVLSPDNPLTYVLDSLASLYSGNLQEADRLMQEALALNPEVPFTQTAAAYLERQKQQFPRISVLTMTNL